MSLSPSTRSIISWRAPAAWPPLRWSPRCGSPGGARRWTRFRRAWPRSQPHPVAQALAVKRGRRQRTCHALQPLEAMIDARIDVLDQQRLARSRPEQALAWADATGGSGRPLLATDDPRRPRPWGRGGGRRWAGVGPPSYWFARGSSIACRCRLARWRARPWPKPATTRERLGVAAFPAAVHADPGAAASSRGARTPPLVKLE